MKVLFSVCFCNVNFHLRASHNICLNFSLDAILESKELAQTSYSQALYYELIVPWLCSGCWNFQLILKFLNEQFQDSFADKKNLILVYF